MNFIDIVLIVAAIGAICFGGVLLFGAPYLPTLRSQTELALDMLELQRGQTLLELGSGDGRMLQAAARRGIHAVGYELNPLLVCYSRLRLLRYRHLVRVHQANFWRTTLPEADGIYVFLLKPYMPKLHNKIVQEAKSSVKLASFAFPISDKKPVRVEKGLFLYHYSAHD